MTGKVNDKVMSAKARRRWYAAQSHFLLILFSLFFLLPFYWLVITSLKSPEQVFTSPPVWVPLPPLWGNYVEAVQFIPFGRYLVNTLWICFWTVVGTVLSSSLVAYSFARIRWYGRDKVFIILLATMMLPAQVTLIPVFQIFKSLGWIGTFLPLIVPSFMGSAFFIFLLRQFYLGIPMELSEAARLDGCSEFSIFWRIVLPLSKPAILTVALFTFLGSWNDFLGPLIYLTDNDKYTLAVGLQQFLGQYDAEWAMLMACSTIMTIPVFILFFLTQKSFIQGIALSGIKG